MSEGECKNADHYVPFGLRSDGTCAGRYPDFNRWNGKVHSAFRISTLVEVLQNLSEAKKQVLGKMGFSGLLKLPKEESTSDRPFKLRFSYWLLTKLEAKTGVLDLGDRGKLKLEDEDVSLVFGLNAFGEELDAHAPSKLDQNRHIIRNNLLLGIDDEVNMQTIKEVIQRDISDSTDDALAKAFMTAVVIYVVSCFLAPKGRPLRVNTDIFDSIIIPDRILNLNWCSYVLRNLRESSAKVKADVLASKSSVCLDGCLLFLQILYLDSIKLGSHTTSQCKRPRVADFPYERLKELIRLDKFREYSAHGDEYGSSELRHPAETFYTMGQLYRRKLDRLFTKSPSEFELDKVLGFIDQENFEHKRNIMSVLQKYGNELCNLSDIHNQEIKNIVIRSKSVEICREKDSDYEARKDIYHFKSADAQQTKNSSSTMDTPTQHDFVDLTGSDDDDKQHVEGCKMFAKDTTMRAHMAPGHSVGIRCRMKRPAQRTPIAVRRKMIGDEMAEQSDLYKDRVVINNRECPNQILRTVAGDRDVRKPGSRATEFGGRIKIPARKTLPVKRKKAIRQTEEFGCGSSSSN